MIRVLDHGYVTLIETWGKGEAHSPEAGIIEAARQSTQGSFRGWEPLHDENCLRTIAVNACVFIYGPTADEAKATRCTCKPTTGDEKLLNFLYDHKHSTPFEFAGMTLEIQAPLMVFREWHRHRTQSYNEMYARYTPMPNINYTPDVIRMIEIMELQKNDMSDGNRQAGSIKGSPQLSEKSIEEFRKVVSIFYEHAEATYQYFLAAGIPKELARLVIPVGRYSRMRATANLRNWLAFLTLRLDKNAQWEIRQYAQVVAHIISEQFPRTYKAFVKNQPK